MPLVAEAVASHCGQYKFWIESVKILMCLTLTGHPAVFSGCFIYWGTSHMTPSTWSVDFMKFRTFDWPTPTPLVQSCLTASHVQPLLRNVGHSRSDPFRSPASASPPTLETCHWCRSLLQPATTCYLVPDPSLKPKPPNNLREWIGAQQSEFLAGLRPCPSDFHFTERELGRVWTYCRS